MKFKADELLTTGFFTQLGQLPPLVTQFLPPNFTLPGQPFRQALFLAFAPAAVDLTTDQVHAAQLSEYLALAWYLTPPAFSPQDITPTVLAKARARSFASTYLGMQYVNEVTQVGTPAELSQALIVDAGDLQLAQLRQLTLNYHQELTVADYLRAQKHQTGLLGSMIARQALGFQTRQPDLLNLAGQIGQGVAVAAQLQFELEHLADATWFKQRLVTGQYPLTLLFARQTKPGWFSDFFAQPHQPGPIAFQTAQRHCQQAAYQVQDLQGDLLAQAKLDLAALPLPGLQKQVQRLLDLL